MSSVREVKPAKDGESQGWSGPHLAPLQPLVRPAPRSTMFFPVAVLVAILPGLYALRNWDLNPPGPWWGMRGLAVLEGNWLDQTGMSDLPPGPEARSYRAVALQPPLYAWLEGLGLWFSGDRSPMATVWPSYLAGAAVVILVYLLGKLWLGRGVGLIAAVLTGFNRALLAQMQQATPTTLGLAGAITSIFAYARFLENRDDTRARWVLLGGLGLGISLLSVGAFGLLVIPLVLLHQALIRPGTNRFWSRRSWLHDHPVLITGILALGLGLILAGPWHIMMWLRHGRGFAAALLAPPQAGGPAVGLLARAIDLAPATLPLGLFAAARAARKVLAADEEDRTLGGGAFCLAWLALAALAPAVLPQGPRPAMSLFLLMPLELLAAWSMVDLAGRRIPARTLCWLAPASAATVAWWTSSHLRDAVTDILALRMPNSASSLGIHLAVDLLLVFIVGVPALDRWAKRGDDRRLMLLGGFLAAVLAITITAGLREVRFRHRETADLLALREVILRREAQKPFTALAVVGPAPMDDAQSVFPAGRLRFLLRATLPKLSQINLTRVDGLLRLPPGQRLVVFCGASGRLDYVTQSYLGLEAIYPGRSEVLEAFSSRGDDAKTVRR